MSTSVLQSLRWWIIKLFVNVQSSKAEEFSRFLDQYFLFSPSRWSWKTCPFTRLYQQCRTITIAQSISLLRAVCLSHQKACCRLQGENNWEFTVDAPSTDVLMSLCRERLLAKRMDLCSKCNCAQLMELNGNIISRSNYLHSRLTRAERFMKHRDGGNWARTTLEMLRGLGIASAWCWQFRRSGRRKIH